MTTEAILHQIDEVRRKRGLLTIEEVLALAAHGNVVFDPFSTLIARSVQIGRDNILYPDVQLLGLAPLLIGDGNTLHTGTRIEAVTGPIHIGHRNEIGDGGFSARALADGARITIGDEGRYTLNCAVTGVCDLGSGSQILGPITVDNCRLGAGGSHREPDADLRGAVLKGTGRARKLTLARGQAIQGFGVFDMRDVKMQSLYHPQAEQRT